MMPVYVILAVLGVLSFLQTVFIVLVIFELRREIYKLLMGQMTPKVAKVVKDDADDWETGVAHPDESKAQPAYAADLEYEKRRLARLEEKGA